MKFKINSLYFKRFELMKLLLIQHPFHWNYSDIKLILQFRLALIIIKIQSSFSGCN